MDFALVVEAFKTARLDAVILLLGVHELVAVDLPHRDVELQICGPEGVNNIVHLLIHTLDQIAANIIFQLYAHLHNPLLRVRLKIPQQDHHHLQLVIDRVNLQPIFFHRFNDFHYLDVLAEMHVNMDHEIFQILIPQKHVIFKEEVLEAAAAMKNDQVIVKNLSEDLVRLALVQLVQVEDQILILAVVKVLFRESRLFRSDALQLLQDGHL